MVSISADKKAVLPAALYVELDWDDGKKYSASRMYLGR
jgi:hypothetical protein